jgi:hypothetical protein
MLVIVYISEYVLVHKPKEKTTFFHNFILMQWYILGGGGSSKVMLKSGLTLQSRFLQVYS